MYIRFTLKSKTNNSLLKNLFEYFYDGHELLVSNDYKNWNKISYKNLLDIDFKYFNQKYINLRKDDSREYGFEISNKHIYFVITKNSNNNYKKIYKDLNLLEIGTILEFGHDLMKDNLRVPITLRKIEKLNLNDPYHTFNLSISWIQLYSLVDIQESAVTAETLLDAPVFKTRKHPSGGVFLQLTDEFNTKQFDKEYYDRYLAFYKYLKENKIDKSI